MDIAEVYSHLNGEEYLLARKPNLYDEIKDVTCAVDCQACVTKISKERTMRGKTLVSPRAPNRLFSKEFRQRGWIESRYQYYDTTNRKLMEDLMRLPLKEQKILLNKAGVASPILSYKQTDFVKDRVAIEVQFGKYAFVAFDLFVKHLLFYSGDVIAP